MTPTEQARVVRGLPIRDIGAELTIRLGWRLRWSDGELVPAAVIEQPRTTASGRAGKPTRLLLLVGDQGVPALLRQVADLLDPDGPEIAAAGDDPGADDVVSLPAIVRVAGDPHRWFVASNSIPGAYWPVTYDPATEELTCPCPAHERCECRHHQRQHHGRCYPCSRRGGPDACTEFRSRSWPCRHRRLVFDLLVELVRAT